MSLDDQLISRNNRSNQEADNSQSNASSFDNEEENSPDKAAALRAAQQEKKNGAEPESEGDINIDKLKKSRLQKTTETESENKVAAIALSPAKQGLSKVLQSAWLNLIPTFGLTLIWIDLHYILSFVFGKDLFCDLGEEWIPAKLPVSGAGKAVGISEKMGCLLLNLGCLLLIILVLAVISMIASAIENPWQATWALMKTTAGVIAAAFKK